MDVQRSWPLLLLVAFMSVHPGSCIWCYYCNSGNNSACLDLRQYEEPDLVRLIPRIRCEQAVPKEYAVNFFCRKIQQTILEGGRDPLVRVTRGCGWVPHHKPCYTNDNSDHLETVCQCFTDDCNAAPRPSPGTALAALAALASVAVGLLRARALA